MFNAGDKAIYIPTGDKVKITKIFDDEIYYEFIDVKRFSWVRYDYAYKLLFKINDIELNCKEIKEDSNVETRDLKCPNCGASLNVSTMNDIYKCEYCDSNIYIKEV